MFLAKFALFWILRLLVYVLPGIRAGGLHAIVVPFAQPTPSRYACCSPTSATVALCGKISVLMTAALTSAINAAAAMMTIAMTVDFAAVGFLVFTPPV